MSLNSTHTRLLWTLSLFFLSLTSSVTTQANNLLHSADGTVWRLVELPFTSSAKYATPIFDVSFFVTFSPPAGSNQSQILRPGYFDGDQSFAVRFAAPVPGIWTWLSTCSNASDTGLNGLSGHLIIAPDGGGVNPFYSHGFVRVRADGRRFEHADGTPFRWLERNLQQFPSTVSIPNLYPTHIQSTKYLFQCN